MKRISRVPLPRLFLVFCLLPLGLSACTQVQNIGAGIIPKGDATVSPAEIKSGTYTLDPEHASVVFSFNHMGFSRTRVRFDEVEATLVYDNRAPEAARLSVRIDLASVNSNVADFDALLISDEFFDTANYPEAAFSSETVVFNGDGTAEAPGTLTLNGITRPVTLTLALTGAGANWVSGKYTLGFAATARVDREEFGLNNLLALTGNEVLIEIDAEFQKGDQ